MRRLVPSLVLIVAVACTPPNKRSPDSEVGERERAGDQAVGPATKSTIEAPAIPELSLPAMPDVALEPAFDGFELLDSGTEPREILRFHPSIGARERVELTLTMTVSLSGAGIPPMRQALPPIKQVTTADVVGIADDRITQNLVHGDLRVDGPGDSESLQAAMQKISEFEQTLILDASGRLLENTRSVPADAPPQLAKTLETIGKTVEQTMVRFPPEPVGVGGRWKASSPLQNGGLELEQTVVFELVARDGDQLELETQVSQRPQRDKFTAPGQTDELDIVEFESKGASRLRYDLGKLTPDAARSRIETRFTAKTPDEAAREISFEMLVELSIVRLED